MVIFCAGSIAVIWGGTKIFANPTWSANGLTILGILRAMGGVTTSGNHVCNIMNQNAITTVDFALGQIGHNLLRS